MLILNRVARRCSVRSCEYSTITAGAWIRYRCSGPSDAHSTVQSLRDGTHWCSTGSHRWWSSSRGYRSGRQVSAPLVSYSTIYEHSFEWWWALLCSMEKFRIGYVQVWQLYWMPISCLSFCKYIFHVTRNIYLITGLLWVDMHISVKYSSSMVWILMSEISQGQYTVIDRCFVFEK